jgi:hypothetical protein
MVRCSVVALVLLLVCAPLGFAQLDRATLTGMVNDSSGAVMPEVKVTLRNMATGVVSESVTNMAGQYRIPNLPIGRYEVVFELPGFKRFVRSGVELGVMQVVRVDAMMEVGTITESVEVSAALPRLQTDTPDVGTALSGKQIVDLPLSFAGARLAENFAYKIAPGVTGGTWTSYINGSTAFSKETLLDGAPASTNRAGHFGESAVSVEAIEEFKIQTSGISAEFGRVQVGVFNYVMKSGSNQIHGSAYGAIRNEAFNANTFANKAVGRARPLDRRFNYAGSFGGPVYIPKVYDGRNKTFFYTTFERYWERNFDFGSPSATVPLPEFYDGNFSRLLGAATGQMDALGRPVLRGAVYDPTTFRQIAGGRWVGDVFPNNQIPVSRFSSVSQKLNAIAKQHYLPPVRDANGLVPLVNNAYHPASGAPMFDQYNYSLKADQNVSSKHRISSTYSFTTRPRFQAGSGYGRLWDMNDPEGGPLAGSRYQTLKSNLGRVSYNVTATPTLLNHFVAYINRQANHYGNEGTEHGKVDGAKVLGIQGLTQKGFPRINWGGGPFVTLTGAGDPVDEIEAFVSWGFLNTASYNRGRHFLKMGFDHRRYHVNFRAFPAAQFNFAARGTAIPNEAFAGNLTGYSFASYLLGIVDSGSLSDPIGTGGRRHYSALFLQDDFKVSSRLTLNLGLRWDFQPPAFEVADRFSHWTPNVIDPISGRPGAYEFAGDCNGCTGRRYFGRKYYREFGPRIGLAWRPAALWSIRASYGIMYEGDAFNGARGTPTGGSTQTAWSGTWPLVADAVNPWQGIFNWDSGFPTHLYMPPVKNLSWGNSNGPAHITDDYNKSPYIQQWNFNIQRELLKDLVLDVGYVGVKGTRLRIPQLARWNQLPASYLSQYGTRLNNPVRNAEEAAKEGIPYPFPGFRGTVASALRDYPQVVSNNTIFVYGAPLGFSTYHGLQVTVNRQFSRGLTVYGNYVWSKAMSNVESSEYYNNPGRPLDYYNLGLEKSIAEQDRPHMVKAFIAYELPFGRGRSYGANVNRFWNSIIGGWGFSGILNYFSGAPLGFSGSFPLSGGWNGATNRANIAPGVLRADAFSKANFELSTPSSPNNTYLNKALFSDPAPLTLGTAAPRYSQARGFGVMNEDLSLQKAHRINEKYRVMFRAQMLNATNRHILGGIITSVTNPNFGQVTSVSGNRVMQMEMRLDF